MYSKRYEVAYYSSTLALDTTTSIHVQIAHPGSWGDPCPSHVVAGGMGGCARPCQRVLEAPLSAWVCADSQLIPPQPLVALPGLCWLLWELRPWGCSWVPREMLSVSQIHMGLADPWERCTALQQQLGNKQGVMEWRKRH